MIPKLNQKFSPLVLLFSISTLVIPGEASPVTAMNHNLLQRAAANTTQPLDCTTDFSMDYYGFGVRLGVYFAWLSSYFANTMLSSEINGSLDTNSIFLLALLASLFKGTLAHEIYQVDGLIIMHLSSGFLFSSLSIWGYRTKYYQQEGPAGIQYFGRYGTHARLALTTAISVYGCWFWWEGVDDGLIPAKNAECRQIFTWLFTKWAVGKGINIFYVVLSLSASIYYCSMCAAAVITYTLKLFRPSWRGKMKFETGFNSWELKLLYNILRVFNIFWIVFCASMIEMTLTENNMINTLAQNGKIAYPAQLLPLLAGALSFVRVLWLIIDEWRKPGSRKTPSVLDRTRYEGARGEMLTPVTPSYSKSRKFGLGLFSPSAQSDTTAIDFQQTDMVNVSRPWYLRYAVALLPWLSAYDFWTKGGAYARPLDFEGSPPIEMHKKGGMDIDVRYLPTKRVY